VLGTDHRRHLVYEVLLENPTASPVRIDVVQVLDAARRTAVANYAGPTLEAVMFVGAETGIDPGRTLAPGAGGILLLDVAQRPEDPLPIRLEHRFVLFRGPLPAVVTDAPTEVNRQPAVIVRPPLHGPNLAVLGCCGVPFAHRLALMPVDGELFLAQRFAIDFVRLDAGTNTFAGDPASNASYFVHGDEVVAVAAGTITATRDGMAENVPPNSPPDIGLDTAAGNFVNQDLGGGRFALYAHLQPGSLRVKPGDRVQPGQVLGLVGNTGNSSEPHLHFHVMDGQGGPSNLGAEGIPYVFDRFRLDGRVLGLDGTLPALVRVPARPPSERTRQYPLTGDVVAFR
jgi:Peptidase family M23